MGECYECCVVSANHLKLWHPKSVVHLTRSSKVPSSAPLQVFPRITAKLVPKILSYNLHVLEDEDIIKWLGRETLVETCINGSLG